MNLPDPIEIALAEDIGPGDLTSSYFVAANHISQARIYVKEKAVCAGVEIAAQVFRRVDPELKVELTRASGAPLQPGETVLTIAGLTRSILTAERVALNFLQHLSGVATLTASFVAKVSGTGARILDTRKTTPGLRHLEKEAVRAGGGQNHRMGLYDGVIVKDNHLLARPSISQAVAALRLAHPDTLIEIEADRFAQVEEFVQIPHVDVILLDNMSLDEMARCVALRRGQIKFEASGGVDLTTVEAIARSGVDYISVGALTHSSRAIDFSLELT